MGKDSGSPPPAPDYSAAAKETAAGNLEAARYATKANRVNQYTPYGSLTYTQGGGGRTFDQDGFDKAMADYNAKVSGQSGGYVQPQNGVLNLTMDDLTGGTNAAANAVRPNEADYWRTSGDPDQWSSSINLSPVGQQLLDYSNQAQLGLGRQIGQGIGRVDQSLSKPFDYGSVQALSDDAYRQEVARLDPEWAKREAAQAASLANQGITAGGEAYDNAMRVFNQGRNDAYTQARRNAFNMMPQTFQLAQALRSQPINELNALRTGAQVTNPTFTPVPQQQTTAGPNLLGAAGQQYQGQMDAYNADVANQNAMMGGLFSLGGSLMGSPWLGKILTG